MKHTEKITCPTCGTPESHAFELTSPKTKDQPQLVNCGHCKAWYVASITLVVTITTHAIDGQEIRPDSPHAIRSKRKAGTPKPEEIEADDFPLGSEIEHAPAPAYVTAKTGPAVLVPADLPPRRHYAAPMDDFPLGSKHDHREDVTGILCPGVQAGKTDALARLDAELSRTQPSPPDWPADCEPRLLEVGETATPKLGDEYAAPHFWQQITDEILISSNDYGKYRRPCTPSMRAAFQAGRAHALAPEEDRGPNPHGQNDSPESVEWQAGYDKATTESLYF